MDITRSLRRAEGNFIASIFDQIVALLIFPLVTNSLIASGTVVCQM